MRTCFVAVFICLSLYSQAQELSIGLESGYGFYNMSSLREMESVVEGNAIPYKQVQSFPATPFVKGFARMRIENVLSTGIVLGYSRTGSRMTYSDYSGSAYRDVVVNGLQVGSSNLFQVYKMDNYLLNVRLNIGAVFNSTTFEHSISLNDAAYSVYWTSKFTSINPYFSVGADITRTLGRFAVTIFADYEFNVPGDVKLKSSNTSNPSPSNFDVDWGGARIGLSCAYRFLKDQ
jgi:hypothetical protein